MKGRLALSLLKKVAGNQYRLAASLDNGSFRVLCILMLLPVCNGHVGSFFGKVHSNSTPDTGVGSSHQSYLRQSSQYRISKPTSMSARGNTQRSDRVQAEQGLASTFPLSFPVPCTSVDHSVYKRDQRQRQSVDLMQYTPLVSTCAI